MINPSFDKLSKINSSRYAIVVLASKRARRIVAGSKPLIDTKESKPVTIAIDEIMAGAIRTINPNEVNSEEVVDVVDVVEETEAEIAEEVENK